MTADKNNIFRISTNNVGPLKNETFQITEPKHKKRFCIYANNGSGKTILSRCLNLPSLNNLIDKSQLYSTFPHLINLNETIFNFEFGFFQENETYKKLTISGDKFGNINISNNSDYIFYVFNEDYVKKNIREKKYKIDSNIEGYIIGSSAINLDEQYRNLEILNQDKQNFNDNIQQEISKTLRELYHYNVSKNTTEYKNITYDNVLLGNKLIVKDSFENYVREHNKLKTLPDDIPLINELNDFTIEDICEYNNMLNEKYTLENFSEKFKKEILSKLEFVKNGLVISDGSTCPFCGQKYNSDANHLIEEYTKFINDEQTQIISNLKEKLMSIKQIPSLYSRYLVSASNVEKTLTTYCEYFPSLDVSNYTSFMSNEELEKIINELSIEFQKKIDNITLSIDISGLTKKLNSFIKETQRIKKINNLFIQKVNKSLSDIDVEKLSIKRNLCKSSFNQLIDNTSENVKNLKLTIEKISIANAEIKRLQATVQLKKKDLISTTLKELLGSFFKDKYEFDEDTFQFKLLNHDVTNDLDYVLSEAEKNIVAFCHYIASIYEIVETKDDLNKIFYIIDDPVSSMDFQYVYNVSLIINNYCKKKFGTNVLLLTHNLEFFNIVLKNGLIDVGISLHNGKFKKLSDNILMPYENHLKDIYEVSEGKEMPSHTTPNSIRHILESINKFKNPQQKLEEFISSEEILNENSPIIKIMQSFSHGEIREEISYTDDMIVDACKSIVLYIKMNFPGQIERIKSI